MVAGAEPVAVGLRLQPGPRWHRLPPGLPRHEEGLCQWELPVCRHVVRQALAVNERACLGWHLGVVMGIDLHCEPDRGAASDPTALAHELIDASPCAQVGRRSVQHVVHKRRLCTKPIQPNQATPPPTPCCDIYRMTKFRQKTSILGANNLCWLEPSNQQLPLHGIHNRLPVDRRFLPGESSFAERLDFAEEVAVAS